MSILLPYKALFLKINIVHDDGVIIILALILKINTSQELDDKKKDF